MPKSSSVVTIDQFLAVTEKRLKRLLPKDRVQEILNEVGSHFSDRTEDLQLSGLSKPEAEAAAVNMFGEPKEWAKSVVDAAYADKFTNHASRISTCAAAIFLFGLTVTPLLFAANLAVIEFLVICFVVGAFLARRRHTSNILKVGLGAAALSFLISGAVEIPVIPGVVAVPPTTYNTVSGMVSVFAKVENQNSEMLTAGWNAYVVGKPIAKVPAKLRDGAGYIVPLTPNADHGYWVFRKVSGKFYPLGGGKDIAPTFSPYRTVATESEAAAIWRANAPKWRAIVEDGGGMIEMQAMLKQQHCKRSGWFDFKAALPGIWIVLLPLPLILLLDCISVGMGRAVYRVVQRRKLSIG